MQLDNTASERALRQIAVGRNNYLFAGSDQGGERAAIAYTVAGTCKLAEIDPLTYLTDVFQKLAAGWPTAPRRAAPAQLGRARAAAT